MCAKGGDCDTPAAWSTGDWRRTAIATAYAADAMTAAARLL
jgi:hypothetical protein